LALAFERSFIMKFQETEPKTQSIVSTNVNLLVEIINKIKIRIESVLDTH
jgi:hypothetical protein